MLSLESALIFIFAASCNANLYKNLTEGEVLLENITEHHLENKISGNVLIYKNGKLWSVCDDGWNIYSARVVCRSLKLGIALRALSRSYFGDTKYDIGLDNVQCYGDETELLQCRHEPFGRHNCNKKEAAGVTCSTVVDISSSSKTQLQTTKATPGNKVINSFSPGNRNKAKSNHIPSMYEVRITNGRTSKEGRVEVKIADEWNVICGDEWTIFEAMVVCRQIGMEYAQNALQSNFFRGENLTKAFMGIKCDGDESFLHECYHEQIGTGVICSRAQRVAGVICTSKLPDLVPNATLVEKTVHLHDQAMYYLQCAMEENCAAPSAFEIKKSRYDWHVQRRRLLRFSSSIWNFGTADFRPELRKQDWEWHLCHMHYHSMQVFAHYDILDNRGNRVAEGHKASFCLEDVQCKNISSKKYACKGFGDQGISVGCADDYLHDIDCQWIDITDVDPGYYTLKVHVNPNYKIAELDFSNNAVLCNVYYSGFDVKATNCVIGRG